MGTGRAKKEEEAVTRIPIEEREIWNKGTWVQREKVPKTRPN